MLMINLFNRRFFLVLICVLAILLSWRPYLDAEVIDRIVAIVNSDIITMSELEDDLRTAKLGEGSRVRGFEGSKDPWTPFIRERLNRIIDKRLQLQLAKRMGISVNQEEISGAIEDIKRKNSIRDDKEFDRALEDEHLPLERFKADIKDQLTIIKLINREVRSRIIIRDEELRDYYNQNRSLFAFPPEVKISQILIPIPKGASGPVVEGLREKASGLVKEIRDNGDFFNSAKRYRGIIDRLAVTDLGSFKKGDLIPPLEEAILSLKAGEVSEPIVTQAGIHIIRLDEKGSIRYRPLEEVIREVEEQVYQKRYNEALEIWLKEIRNTAYVEVRL